VDLKALHRCCVASQAAATQMVSANNRTRARVGVAMEGAQQRFERSTRALNRARAYLVEAGARQHPAIERATLHSR
jgi:hypothetical protein